MGVQYVVVVVVLLLFCFCWRVFVFLRHSCTANILSYDAVKIFLKVMYAGSACHLGWVPLCLCRFLLRVVCGRWVLRTSFLALEKSLFWTCEQQRVALFDRLVKR